MADASAKATGSSAATTAPAARRGAFRWVYRRCRGALAFIGLLLLIYHLGFGLSQVVSPSMSPTLRGDSSLDGDWVLSERVSLWFRRPRRGEVIQFVDKDGNEVMKRVVGLPGERVQLVDGDVVIDGKVAPRPASLGFIKYFAFGKVYGGKAIDCGDGYFVLGDDSRDSYDSRYEGPFESWRVRGRAWLRVWPRGRIGKVNP